MATLTITLGQFSNSYTAGNADVQRVLDVYRSEGMSDADVARLISDGWIDSLIGQVRGVELNAARADLDANYVPITIPHN